MYRNALLSLAVISRSRYAATNIIRRSTTSNPSVLSGSSDDQLLLCNGILDATNYNRAPDRSKAFSVLQYICELAQGESQLNKDYFIEALSQTPYILSTYPLSRWKDTVETLLNQGFPLKRTLDIITALPQLIDRGGPALEAHLDRYRKAIPDQTLMCNLFYHCPYLFETDFEQVSATWGQIRAYFPLDRSIDICSYGRTVIKDDVHTIKLKFAYLLHYLFVRKKEIAETKALAHSFDFIKLRYNFLIDLGAYVIPDPKKSIQVANPSVGFVLDSSDKFFATTVAKATLEEFVVYQELKSRAKFDGDDDNDEDNLVIES